MATRFEKYASERYDIDLQWSGRLPPGKTLYSVTASATRTDTGADATATVLGTASPPVSGTAAAVNIKGGTANLEYDIKLISTFLDGSTLEDHWIMFIK